MAANVGPTRLLCTIGLDIGTTTVKALAFDQSGQRIAGSSAEVTTLLQDENAEQDPEHVYSLCVEVLAQTAASAIGSGYHLGRVGISAAMHSILAVSEDDTPLTNAMLWMDGRAHAEAEELWLDLLEKASSSSSEGLVCLPYVAGERAPLWDASASGLFFGLRLHHRPEHLVRATVEGLLFNARWLAEDLLSRPPSPEYLMTTGGVLSPGWIQQLASNIFGLPVFPGSRSDASARGAALLADIAAGKADWPAAARPAEPPAAVPSTTLKYQAGYARFRQICSLTVGGGGL
jgi:sugar (pentulose or hexulose) kinase